MSFVRVREAILMGYKRGNFKTTDPMVCTEVLCRRLLARRVLRCFDDSAYLLRAARRVATSPHI